MNGSAPCRFADEVVAHLLDGDCDTATPPLQLDQHLQACWACRQTLARARRLDALVAATASIDDARRRTEALLDQVQGRLGERVRPSDHLVRHGTPKQARRTARRLVATATVLLAAMLAVWLVRSPMRGSDPDRTPAAAIACPTAAAPSLTAEEWLRQRGAIVLADATPASHRDPEAAPRRAPESPAADSLDVLRLSRTNLAARARPSVAGLEWAFGLLRPQQWDLTARRVADATWIAAAISHAERGGGRSSRSLVAAILAPQPAAEAAELLSALRRTPLGSTLARELTGTAPVSPTTLRAAAQLGGASLDAVLRSRVRGDLALTEDVAAAAARPVERPGRVGFLLDLWSDLQTRGLEPAIAGERPAAAEERAARWFLPLPATATDELIAEAARTPQAGQRRRCLLALAARRDPAAVPYLLQAVVDGARLEESLLAACALGRCLTAGQEARVWAALPQSRRPELLWAALASCRSARFQSLLPQLALAPSDRAMLRAGDFDAGQFPVAVALLRALPSERASES